MSLPSGLKQLASKVGFPAFNPVRFGVQWYLNTARTSAEENVWPFIEAVGPVKMQEVIDSGKPLHQFLAGMQLPPEWTDAVGKAKDYKWIVEVMEPTDVLTLLPEWLQQLILRNNQSIAWFMNELRFWLAIVGIEKELSDDGLIPTHPGSERDDQVGSSDIDQGGGSPRRFVPIGRSNRVGQAPGASNQAPEGD